MGSIAVAVLWDRNVAHVQVCDVVLVFLQHALLSNIIDVVEIGKVVIQYQERLQTTRDLTAITNYYEIGGIPVDKRIDNMHTWPRRAGRKNGTSPVGH